MAKSNKKNKAGGSKKSTSKNVAEKKVTSTIPVEVPVEKEVTTDTLTVSDDVPKTATTPDIKVEMPEVEEAKSKEPVEKKTEDGKLPVEEKDEVAPKEENEESVENKDDVVVEEPKTEESVEEKPKEELPVEKKDITDSTKEQTSSTLNAMRNILGFSGKKNAIYLITILHRRNNRHLSKGTTIKVKELTAADLLDARRRRITITVK